MPNKRDTRPSNLKPIDLDDEELLELESLLQEDMYTRSEAKLHPFFVNFWNCHDPSKLHTSWVQECIAEHVEAAMKRQIRRLTIQVPPRCLPLTTQVLMSDGSYKQLSTMKVGDYVKSSDGTEITDEQVTAVIDSGVKDCIKFTFNDGSTLTTSTLHKIYTPKGFVQAKDLVLKDVVHTHSNYISLTSKLITAIEDAGELPCMDLTVSNHHTFFADDTLVSNSGKSLMSVSSICWHWLQNPWEKFWLVSHSERLYTQNIVLARTLMDHPLYKTRWMDKKSEHFKFELSKDVNTKTRVENDQGGYILGGSPTSKALGVGYNVAFLDDVLDSEQANSPDAIQRVNDWYTQTFLNRSNDVNNDVQIIFMQRLHQNDITNYVNTVYEDQGWFNLILPAKLDRKRIFTSPIGFNDKRIHQNQLLDPVRLPEHFLAAQAKNPIIYNTRYQQNPGAGGEGNLVKADWLQQTDKLPANYDQMITVWDLSFGDSATSTYSVGLVIGIKEGHFYIIDMIRGRMAVPEQVDSIRKLKEKYPRSQIGIEKRANGNAALSLLEREIHNIYAFQPRLFGGSKEQRLSAVLTYMRDKLVHIYAPFKVDTTVESDYDADTIMSELTAFPLGANDDIVDCIGYGIQWLAQYGKETTAIVTRGLDIVIPELGLSNELTLRSESLDTPEGGYDYSIFGDIMSRDYIQDLF